jgi:peptidoglycan-associated lipoprotein
MNRYSTYLIALLAAFAAGCASNEIPDPEPENETASADVGTDADDSGGFGQGESFGDDSSTNLGTVIYFDYDQAELRPEYLDLLARHADRMAGSNVIELRLEGHADERGSREYNIGLGERRSQAVRRILEANGVPAQKLSTVSFGEERPAVTGSSEQSYALNRRVEINYMD